MATKRSEVGRAATTSGRFVHSTKTQSGSTARSAVKGRSTKASKAATWSVPRGRDLRTVTKDATHQVIRNYGETLRKLERN